MKKHVKLRKIGMRILNLLVLLVTEVFFLHFYLYRTGAMQTSSEWMRNILIYSGLFWVLVSKFDLYKIGNIRLIDAFSGQLFCMLGTNIGFFAQFWLGLPEKKNVQLGCLVCVTLLQFFFGLFAYYVIHRIYMKIVPKKRVLAIVGEKPEDTILQTRMRVNQYFQIVEIVSATEDTEVIMQKAQQCDGLLLGDISVQRRNALLRRSFQEGIEIFYMLKIADILVQNSKKYKVYDQTFLLNHNQGLSLWQRMVKRCFDVVASVILLVLLSPLSLVIMLLIKAEDGGRIFFKQLRVTQNGREFYIYKFRSMYEDAEKQGPQLYHKGDKRVTKIGRIIRNLHFDEIPQFVNVLKGDMSLVGPRPERQVFIEEYKKNLPEFESRLKVKAGVTGYAQIYGKYNSNPYDKLKLDLIYINHYSILLDLQLLLQTIRILFQKEDISDED